MGRLTDNFNTGNPVDQDEDHLRAWCWDHNKWAARIGLNRWYYIHKDTSSDGTKTMARRILDGMQAEEVKAVLDGKRIEYYGWPQHKIDTLERKAKHFMKLGMPA